MDPPEEITQTTVATSLVALICTIDGETDRYTFVWRPEIAG